MGVCGAKGLGTSVISGLVEADKDADDFQVFFGVLQESCKTGGEKKTREAGR